MCAAGPAKRGKCSSCFSLCCRFFLVHGLYLSSAFYTDGCLLLLPLFHAVHYIANTRKKRRQRALHVHRPAGMKKAIKQQKITRNAKQQHHNQRNHTSINANHSSNQHVPQFNHYNCETPTQISCAHEFVKVRIYNNQHKYTSTTTRLYFNQRKSNSKNTSDTHNRTSTTRTAPQPIPQPTASLNEHNCHHCHALSSDFLFHVSFSHLPAGFSLYYFCNYFL